MSSLAVRQITRQWVTAITTPFYNTIAEEQDPADPVWCTCEFDQYEYTKMSYCDQWVESGDIRLTWFGQIGAGELALLQIAESDAATFMQQKDSTGKVVITGRSAPEVFRMDGPQLGVEISFNYEFTP
jgi:hypothetical protein